MSEKYLAGRVAVITGGSRGLGRAMALSLAKRGATIALVGRDRAKLDESQKLVAAEGVEVTTFTCDVREEAQVKKLADDVKAKYGKVHILINNAGTAIRKNLVDFSFDEWKLVIDTNLHGVFLCTKYLLPLMKGHGYGRIINIGSIMGHVGSTGRSAYCATKAGVLSLTKTLGLELAKDDITVVAISPGFYATDLTAPLRADQAKSDALLAQTPQQRWGQPPEIGELAAYICSPSTGFMTGTDILMDGGWVAQ
jgi:NAD(P)-dependent dehydrogenase (short-subunit alcohol dehydrogenase family)